MKSLLKTVFVITGFAVITRILGFIFRIYLSRMLGPEALGLYQVSLSVFMVLLTIVTSGLPLVISKLSAKFFLKKDSNSEGKLISASLIIVLVSSFILVCFVLIFKNLFSFLFTDDRCYPILIVMLPAVLFSGIYNVFRGAMWGHSNYFGYCITELFEQIVRITICVFMLSLGIGSLSPSISAGLSLSIACCFSMVLAIVLYFIYGGKLKKPDKIYKEVIKSSAPITAVRFLSSLVQPVIALIIPARLIAAGYTSTQAMSIFGVTIGMTLPLLFIPITLVGSISTALIPDISAAVSNQEEKYVNNRVTSSITITIFISLFMIPLFIGAGENIGTFFFGNVMSGVLLGSAAWIVLPMALTNITSSMLNALGMEVKSFINYIIGSVFLFLSIWFLPAVIGIKSLIVGMGLCVSATSILNLIMIKRKLKIKLNIIKPLTLMILFVIPSAAITFFVTNLLTGIIPLFFNLAISCMLGASMFLILCSIFNVVNIRTLFVEAKKNKIRKLNFKKLRKKVK